MDKNIYVTMPTLAPLNEVDAYLRQVWESGVMTHNGPLLRKFEHDVAEWHGMQHHTVVVNGTIALQLAIRALELKGEIITSPFSFIATTSAIMYEGKKNYNKAIENYQETNNRNASPTIYSRISHCYSEMGQYDKAKHNIKVIYDACHSVGVRYKGKSVFAYGDVSCTSYHATKMLNSGEGGGCYTNDAELDAKMKRIRFFGFSEDKTNVVEEGSNLKMTEVHASVGLANLKYLQAALDDRKEKYMLYKQLLSVNPNLHFQRINGDSCKPKSRRGFISFIL